MYKKNNVRTTYKSGRRTSYKKSGGYQNFKTRNKGNVLQQYNKYLKLAKESFRSGDRILSEYYYQFTDHYFRLMIELGINIEDSSQSDESKFSSDENSNQQTSNNSDEIVESKPENETSENDSIESIPFIAEPSKEKRSRSNK